MLPNTSRCTDESSCHWSTVARTPEAIVISATTSPIATATWLGLMRRGEAGASDAAGVPVLSAALTSVLTSVLTSRKPTQREDGRRNRPRTAQPLALPVPWRRAGRSQRGAGLPVVLAVELADLAGERGEDLVVEGGHLVEQARELAGPEHEHGQRRGRGDGRRAGAVVEQRQLAHAVAGSELADLLPASGDVGAPFDDDEGLSTDVALCDELLALVDRQLDRRLGDLAQFLGGRAREERNRCKVVQVLLACHGGAAYGPPAVFSLPSLRPGVA